MSDPLIESGDIQFDPSEDPAAWRKRPLYGPFFGLLEAPFDLTPNPRFLFLTPRQNEALSNLRYALATSRGFTLILGEAGTGKTTLVRAALAGIVDTTSHYVLVNNPTLGRDEFYELLASEFNLSAAAARSKTRFLTELQKQVEARFAAGGMTGLIIDEAQSMPRELLEEIRLLGNIETATSKLLNIVLCGQPELADRLNEPSLRNLKQRIALRCELQPLSLSETAAYISGRIRIAGGTPSAIFTRETVMTIFNASTGIPRTINVLCENTLIGGYAADQKPVAGQIAAEVCRDFDLSPGVAALPPASALVRAEDPPRGLPPAPATTTETALTPAPVERPMLDTVPPSPKRRSSFFS